MTLAELKLRMGRDNFMKISDKCLARGISLLGLVCGIMLLVFEKYGFKFDSRYCHGIILVIIL